MELRRAKNLVEKYKHTKFEIWILGDFNVDMMKRDAQQTTVFLKSQD